CVLVGSGEFVFIQLVLLDEFFSPFCDSVVVD
ncbi:MAG: hypothetical protein RLZZ458_855, partial [Planctomycetota bacterium]